VRNLKKQLEKIYRKSALKLVQMGIEVAPAQQPASAAAAQPAEAATVASPASGAAAVEPEVSSSGNDSELQPAAPDAASSNDAGSRQEQLAAAAEGAAATQMEAPLIVVEVSDLKEYVGQPPYPADKIYAEGTPAGGCRRWNAGADVSLADLGAACCRPASLLCLNASDNCSIETQDG
jgi:Lon-like ATP-dependent protease